MKKLFRIFLKGEPQVYYDKPVPDEASLLQFATNVLVSGYVSDENYFIPYASIKHISVMQMVDDKPVPFTPRVVN